MLQLMIILGSLGVLGMTWLFPLCARALFCAQRNQSSDRTAQAVKNLGIVVPAHNESATISKTLESIRCAIKKSRAHYPNLSVTIQVAADGCNDDTALKAIKLGAHVSTSASSLGKWKTLERLILESGDIDCIALVDSGAIWPESLLVEALSQFADSSVVAVAPSYSNLNGGFFERILWSFERHFKVLEHTSGGPLSTHGATVLYRAVALREALGKLRADTQWLNDDVALPLAVRILYPNHRISYLSQVIVEDQRQTQRGLDPQLRRRLRLVTGNLQWISKLLPELFRENFIAGVLALRRVSRVFWAYWTLLLFIGVLGLVAQSAMTAIGVILSLATLSWLIVWLRFPGFGFIEAAFASLAAPYLALERRDLVRRWQ